MLSIKTTWSWLFFTYLIYHHAHPASIDGISDSDTDKNMMDSTENTAGNQTSEVRYQVRPKYPFLTYLCKNSSKPMANITACTVYQMGLFVCYDGTVASPKRCFDVVISEYFMPRPLCINKTNNVVVDCMHYKLYYCHEENDTSKMEPCSYPERQLCLDESPGHIAPCRSRSGRTFTEENLEETENSYANQWIGLWKKSLTNNNYRKDGVLIPGDYDELCRNEDDKLVECQEGEDHKPVCFDRGRIGKCIDDEGSMAINLPTRVCKEKSTNKVLTCGYFVSRYLCWTTDYTALMTYCPEGANYVCFSKGELRNCSKSLAPEFEQSLMSDSTDDTSNEEGDVRKNIENLCSVASSDKNLRKCPDGASKADYACYVISNGKFSGCKPSFPLRVPVCTDENTEEVFICEGFDGSNLCFFSRNFPFIPCNSTSPKKACLRKDKIIKCRQKRLPAGLSDLQDGEMNDDAPPKKEGELLTSLELSEFPNEDKVYKAENRSIEKIMKGLQRLCYDKKKMVTCEKDPNIQFLCYGARSGKVKSCDSFNKQDLVMPVCIEKKTTKVFTCGIFFRAPLCQVSGEVNNVCTTENLARICLTKEGKLQKCNEQNDEKDHEHEADDENKAVSEEYNDEDESEEYNDEDDEKGDKEDNDEEPDLDEEPNLDKQQNLKENVEKWKADDEYDEIRRKRRNAYNEKIKASQGGSRLEEKELEKSEKKVTINNYTRYVKREVTTERKWYDNTRGRIGRHIYEEGEYYHKEDEVPIEIKISNADRSTTETLLFTITAFSEGSHYGFGDRCEEQMDGSKESKDEEKSSEEREEEELYSEKYGDEKLKLDEYDKGELNSEHIEYGYSLPDDHKDKEWHLDEYDDEQSSTEDRYGEKRTFSYYDKGELNLKNNGYGVSQTELNQDVPKYTETYDEAKPKPDDYNEKEPISEQNEDEKPNNLDNDEIPNSDDHDDLETKQEQNEVEKPIIPDNEATLIPGYNKDGEPNPERSENDKPIFPENEGTLKPYYNDWELVPEHNEDEKPNIFGDDEELILEEDKSDKVSSGENNYRKSNYEDYDNDEEIDSEDSLNSSASLDNDRAIRSTGGTKMKKPQSSNVDGDRVGNEEIEKAKKKSRKRKNVSESRRLQYSRFRHRRHPFYSDDLGYHYEEDIPFYDGYDYISRRYEPIYKGRGSHKEEYEEQDYDEASENESTRKGKSRIPRFTADEDSVDDYDDKNDKHKTISLEDIRRKEFVLLSNINKKNMRLCKTSDEKLINCDKDKSLKFACVGARHGEIKECRSTFGESEMPLPICYQGDTKNLVTCDIVSNVKLCLTFGTRLVPCADPSEYACLDENGTLLKCGLKLDKDLAERSVPGPLPNEKFYILECTNCSIDNKMVIVGTPDDVLPETEIFTLPSIG